MEKMKNRYLILSLFLIALALRLFLVPNRGFEADVAFWKSWGLATLDHGAVAGLPLTNNNYPTPFSYFLGFLAYLYRCIANPYDFNSFWNSGNVLFLFIAKLPSILADLGIAGIILWIGKRTRSSDLSVENRSIFPPLPYSFYFLLSILYLFNPVSLIDGAWWGQVDSLGVFVFLTAVILAASDNPLLGGAVFMLSMMTKLQNMIYGPLFFLILWQLGSYKGLVKGILGAVSAFLVLNMEFFLKKSGSAVWKSLTSNYDYFPMMSLNAFNLWWIAAKGFGMQMSDKVLAVGMINAKTTGLILFSTGYLIAVLTMIKETILNMWKNKTEPFKDNAHIARRGTPVERPQSRNLLQQSVYNLGKIFMWSEDQHNTFEECGVRTSDGGKRANENKDAFNEFQTSDILFRFFTSLVIVALSFFLFQTESHDRYAFPLIVFLLFWIPHTIASHTTIKERIVFWKTT